MTLKDFTDFVDGPLGYPYNGKVYTPPAIGIELGMRLSGITNGDAEQNLEGPELFKLFLGTAWDEMVADNVPSIFAVRAAETAIADFQYGRVYAEAFWEAGADPKALTEQIKAQGNRATRRSKSTAGATKTPSPASTKATTSRKH